MKNKSLLLFIISIIAAIVPISAQTTAAFDEKVPVGAGNLFKVRSMDRWGLVDADGNLKLSLEYNEPLFMNGLAVLTKYGSQQLHGVVDEAGKLTLLPPYFINPSFPFVTDSMLAVRESADGNWGFINVETAEPLRVNLRPVKNGKSKIFKSLGLGGKGVKGTFVFDYVAPFVEGIAAVHTPKGGWYHVDKNGQERLMDVEGKPVLFRSSIHNGEAILFTEDGIVMCREMPDLSAGTIRFITEDYDRRNDYHRSLRYPYQIATGKGQLFLNGLFQPDKFENHATGDSIIFIQRVAPAPVVAEKIPAFSVENNLKIELLHSSVSATAKGTAAVTVVVANVGEQDSPQLTVNINIGGTKKEWSGSLEPGAKKQIVLYIPAKFSAASIVRDVEWRVVAEDESQTADGVERVTIKRYKPSRR